MKYIEKYSELKYIKFMVNKFIKLMTIMGLFAILVLKYSVILLK
jgi:hypothetical protein